MRIALFSDIHGNLPALEAILKDIKTKNVDKIISLGDTIGIGPNPKECIELLIQNNVTMVLGNHELYYVKGIEIDDEMGEEEARHHKWIKEILNEKCSNYINSCNLTYSLEDTLFNHFPLLLNPPDDYPFEDLAKVKDKSIKDCLDNINEKYMFIGHEHNPFELEKNGKKLIDIGSSGCRYDNITFYTIFDINSKTIIKKNLAYDRNRLISSVLKEDYPCREFLSKVYFGIDINEGENND